MENQEEVVKQLQKKPQEPEAQNMVLQLQEKWKLKRRTSLSKLNS